MNEPLKERGGKFLESLMDYAQLRMRLMALQMADKSSRLLTGFFTVIILAVIFIFSMVMLSIAVAILLGNALDASWAGYLIVAMIYIVLGVILISMRQKIIFEPLLNAIVKSLAGAEIQAENKLEEVQDKIEDKLDLEKQPESY